MKNPVLIAAVAAAVLLTASPLLRGSETGPEATVAKIRDRILAPDFKPDGIEKDLIEILNVSLAILPEKEYAEEFRSKIAWVKDSFADEHLFADKIRQYLGIAYALVSDGTSWRLPEELQRPYPGEPASIKRATAVCGRLLESALAEMKAGNNEKAAGCLIGFVLLVITPIEA